MRTLVTVPEFRQCGPLLSFLDNAETETPSDKVGVWLWGCVSVSVSVSVCVSVCVSKLLCDTCQNVLSRAVAGIVAGVLARPVQKMR